MKTKLALGFLELLAPNYFPKRIVIFYIFHLNFQVQIQHYCKQKQDSRNSFTGVLKEYTSHSKFKLKAKKANPVQSCKDPLFYPLSCSFKPEIRIWCFSISCFCWLRIWVSWVCKRSFSFCNKKMNEEHYHVQTLRTAWNNWSDVNLTLQEIYILHRSKRPLFQHVSRYQCKIQHSYHKFRCDISQIDAIHLAETPPLVGTLGWLLYTQNNTHTQDCVKAAYLSYCFE